MPYYNNRFMGGMQSRSDSCRPQCRQEETQGAGQQGCSQCQQGGSMNRSSQCQQGGSMNRGSQYQQGSSEQNKSECSRSETESRRPQCPVNDDMRMSYRNSSGEWCQDIFKNAAGPLAMAGVVWQKSGSPVFDMETAFVKGTIYKELDKPFLGKGGCRR